MDPTPKRVTARPPAVRATRKASKAQLESPLDTEARLLSDYQAAEKKWREFRADRLANS